MNLTPEDLAATDDSQKLAILECMLLAIFADGKVEEHELKRFDAIVGALPWGMEKPVIIALLQGAQTRMKTMNTPQAIMDYVAQIAARVPSQTLREKIVFTMGLLAASDGTLHQFEKNILGLCVVSFNITSDRLAAIKSAVAERA
jgi:uncharacterized tellurite resistance protein B-like protein